MVTVPVHVRWIIKQDYVRLAELDDASWRGTPYTDEGFKNALVPLTMLGELAEDDDLKPLGYILYNMEEDAIEITRLAVLPERRREDVGAQLVDAVKRKMRSNRRARTYAEVPEENLDAQLFFRAQGFRATHVKRDTGVYVMAYSLGGKDAAGRD